MRFRLLTFADPFGGTCVFAYVRPHRWNVHVPVVHMQRISNSRPPANFQCITGAFNSNFRIRRNAHLSRHNLRPPQQLDISFVDCRISFVRIVDFFYILYLSLKNYKVCGFDSTYLPIPILQYLFYTQYAVEEMDCMGMSRFLSFSLYFIFSEIIFIEVRPMRHNFH